MRALMLLSRPSASWSSVAKACLTISCRSSNVNSLSSCTIFISSEPSFPALEPCKQELLRSKLVQLQLQRKTQAFTRGLLLNAATTGIQNFVMGCRLNLCGEDGLSGRDTTSSCSFLVLPCRVEPSKLLKRLATGWPVFAAYMIMMSLGRLCRVRDCFLCLSARCERQALLLRHYSAIYQAEAQPASATILCLYGTVSGTVSKRTRLYNSP